MKPAFIVNPRSGGGKTASVWPEIKATITARMGDIEIVHTERQGHATELAKSLAEAGHPLVVAVGGDGTFSEVVAGLMLAQRGGHVAEAGLVGQGTGGDFRRTLGIEHRLDRYLDALTSGRTRRIDVGRALLAAGTSGEVERFFVNILSAGIGGMVDEYVANASRALGGTVAYFVSSARALMNAKLGRVRCTVELDGQTTSRTFPTFLVAVCNGQYFGSGMHMAPAAKVDDGVFEVVAFGATTKVEFARTSSQVYSGKHMRDPKTVHMRGSKVSIVLENDDARDAFLLDVDGEPLSGLPLSIECMASALTLRA